MKRNRKAEEKKRERQLARKETETRQVARLLTDMEAACQEVLLGDGFKFKEGQVTQFLELVREKFKAITVPLSAFSQEKRLGILAQRFGLCGIEVLIETFKFAPEQADGWLKELIEVGARRRK